MTVRRGFLATHCSTCEGEGSITWKQGMEQLQHSAPCAECNGSGFTVYVEVPAVSVEDLLEVEVAARRKSLGIS